MSDVRASWYPGATKPVAPRALVLLGAQRFDPTLRDAVAELDMKGRVATITAGWQERETDDEDLVEHLQGRCVNLRLHARAEEVFKADKELSKAHRERQSVLRQRQDFYRIRLEHALDAEYVISQRSAPESILEDEHRASIEAIRELDYKHIARCARDRREFEDKWRPEERPSVATHRKEIAEILRDCDAIAIAGGHVASLLNRLTLFGIAELAHDKVIFAWCAGAMAISERVVLFHDSPPQGPGAAEVLDTGLGLATNVVVLPQPEFRLKMEDRARVSLMARRFSPALCIAMPARSRVTWLGGVPNQPHGVSELREDGSAGPIKIHSQARIPAGLP
jgi:hypothetical protein